MRKKKKEKPRVFGGVVAMNLHNELEQAAIRSPSKSQGAMSPCTRVTTKFIGFSVVLIFQRKTYLGNQRKRVQMKEIHSGESIWSCRKSMAISMALHGSIHLEPEGDAKLPTSKVLVSAGRHVPWLSTHIGDRVHHIWMLCLNLAS